MPHLVHFGSAGGFRGPLLAGLMAVAGWLRAWLAAGLGPGTVESMSLACRSKHTSIFERLHDYKTRNL
jgi:hypothetical protein